METIGERCKLVREKLLGLESTYQLSDLFKTVGYSTTQTSVWRYEGGERTPDADYLMALKRLAPQLNSEWMLTGQGAMRLTSPVEESVAVRQIEELKKILLAPHSTTQPVPPPDKTDGQG